MRMGNRESFSQLKPARFHVLGMNVVNVPRTRLPAYEVPPETLTAVVHDAGGFGRSPDVVRLVGPVKGAAKERVESADVIHVEVRKEQVVDLLDLAERKLLEAAVPAVEQQAIHRLSAIDSDEQGVVAAGVTENLE
jgi:hypothetical protein